MPTRRPWFLPTLAVGLATVAASGAGVSAAPDAAGAAETPASAAPVYAPANAPDARADALLARVAARYKALRTLGGTVITESQANGKKGVTKATFFLEKPNLMRMIEEGPDGKLTLIADGVNLWSQSDPVKPSPAARFRKEQADPYGYRYYIYGLPTGLRQFFDPRPELFTSSSRDVVNPRLLAPETIDGVAYQVVEMVTKDPAPAVTRLYIDDDLIIRRWVRGKSFESGAGSATVSRLEGISMDAAAPKDAYAYTPPPGEKVFIGLPYQGEVLKVGSKAPDFTLPNPKGGNVQLSQLLKDNKVVLLHFFSVLCKPCHSEIRQVQKFVDRLGSDELAFVLIDEAETPEMVNEFTTRHNFRATVAISPAPKHSVAGKNAKVDGPIMMDQYGVTLLPATYLIDSKGTVLYHGFGFHEDNVRAVVQKLGLKPGAGKARVAASGGKQP